MSAKSHQLRELAKLFLKLGFLGFGGPAAHIAMMEEEVVVRRKWMTREQLLDAIGFANLMPGPTSTELALHIGFLRGRFPGMFLAGFCFIAPAALIVTVLAWAYVQFGSVPQVGPVFKGIHAAVLAIILSACVRLAKTACKKLTLILLGVLTAIAAALGLNEALAIIAAGLAAILIDLSTHKSVHSPAVTLSAMLSFLAGFAGKGMGATSSTTAAVNRIAPTVTVAAAVAPLTGTMTLPGLWWYFLKIGCTVFGSGYVLISYLESDLISKWGILTHQQLLDAIAVGQVTPGPLFTTATFIGFLLHRFSGGFLATVAIFLPSFVFVGVAGWWLPKVRKSPLASAFMDGVNAGSVGLIALVSMRLGIGILTSWPAWVITTGACALLSFSRINPVWLIIAGATLGWCTANYGWS